MTGLIVAEVTLVPAPLRWAFEGGAAWGAASGGKS